MATRDELKQQLYNVFYQEEYDRLNKTVKEFDRKPQIRHTRYYVEENKTIIHFLVAGKLFPKKAGYRKSKAIAGIIISTIIVLIVLFDGSESFLLRIISSAIIVLMIYGITIQQLVKNVPGDDIEISLEGIDLKERHLTWDQIMGTYILLSSYRTQLVLLLNDGEIIKQDLQNYGTFSFRKSKQIAEICQYIEHFKSKVPGW